MSTPEQDIETALFDAVAAMVLDPALPVSWPDVDFDPPATGYLRATHLPGSGRRLFLDGDAPSWALGMLQLDVMLPLGQGSRAAREVAGQVVAAFPSDRKLRAGAVVLRVQRRPDVAQGTQAGAFWQVPVTIRYEGAI